MEHNLNVTKHFSMLTTDTARLSSKTDEKCHMTYKFNFSRQGEIKLQWPLCNSSLTGTKGLKSVHHHIL